MSISVLTVLHKVYLDKEYHVLHMRRNESKSSTYSTIFDSDYGYWEACIKFPEDTNPIVELDIEKLIADPYTAKLYEAICASFLRMYLYMQGLAMEWHTETSYEGVYISACVDYPEKPNWGEEDYVPSNKHYADLFEKKV